MIDFGGHVRERKNLDLTPMIDVVFLLLIFFMLTSIFAKPLLPLALPEAATGVVAREPEVTITLSENKVYLNGQDVPMEGLPALLVSMLAGRGDRDISLRSDKSVPFGRVVMIMDIAKQAGAENISIVTDKKQ